MRSSNYTLLHCGLSFSFQSESIKEQLKDPKYTPLYELSDEDLTNRIAKMGLLIFMFSRPLF